MILTVTLNPAIDKTVWVSDFCVDQVNRIHRIRVDAGGKGINVSKAVAAMGHTTCAIAVLAGQTGKNLLHLLNGVINVHPIIIPGETRTNIKLVDDIHHTHTDINEPGPIVTSHTLNEVMQKILALTQPGDWVSLSGKAPQGAPDTLFADWTLQLHDEGRKVFVDAEGALFASAVSAAPDGVKPNLHELELWYGQRLTTMPAILSAMQKLHAAGIKLVTVSLGSDGALFMQNGTALLAKVPTVEVLGTVGAGDTMVGALLCALQDQKPLNEAARFCCAAGTCAVMTEGTCAPSPDKVLDMMNKIMIESC